MKNTSESPDLRCVECGTLLIYEGVGRRPRYCSQTCRSAGQAAEARTAHLRTQGGRQEVDLILQRYDGKVLAFEVQLASTPTDADTRHLHWLGEQLGSRLIDKVIVNTGTHAYRRDDGVAIVPLALLG